MHFSILSDLKKTTVVVENLSTTSTRCSVTGITSLLQDVRYMYECDLKGIVSIEIYKECEEYIETAKEPGITK